MQQKNGKPKSLKKKRANRRDVSIEGKAIHESSEDATQSKSQLKKRSDKKMKTKKSADDRRSTAKKAVRRQEDLSSACFRVATTYSRVRGAYRYCVLGFLICSGRPAKTID